MYWLPVYEISFCNESIESVVSDFPMATWDKLLLIKDVNLLLETF